jgi:PAS domain S-box-containing protein
MPAGPPVHMAADVAILRAIVDSTADGILVVDNEGHATLSNARFAHLWRIPQDLIDAGSDEQLLAFVLDQLQDPEAFLGKVRDLYGSDRESLDTLRFNDGRVFERYSRPLIHEGISAGRVWSFRDVTDRASAEDALRASEERHRRLVELSPDAIAVHVDGRLTFANAAAAALLGATHPQELIGTPVADLVHPAHRAVLEERARAETDEARSFPWLETKFVRLDGSVVDVEVAGVPFVHRGRTAGQIIARDISAWKRAEASLVQRNEYLAALHETTLNLMNRLGPQDVLQAAVTRAAALVGSKHGYIYKVRPGGEEIEVLVAIGAFRSWIGQRMKPGEGMAGKVWMSGEPMVVDDYDTWDGRSDAFPTGVFRAVVGLPLKTGDEVVGVIGVAHVDESRTFDSDEVELLGRFAGLASLAIENSRLHSAVRQELAERERAEHELRIAEAKYRMLVEQIPAITYTAAFGIEPWTFVSPHIQAILGYTPEEWIASGDVWYLQVHPDDRAAAMEAEHHTQETGEPLLSEYRMLARDGRIVWIRDEAVVVEVDGRRVLQGIMFDITERKRAEAELEAALHREREASTRLRALDDIKNTFLHAVSHELRNPLSAVLGFALTLDREDLDLSTDERRDMVSRIASNARKLDRLLSDLLDLDRLDRGIVEPQRRPTDVLDLIERTVEASGVTEGRSVHLEGERVMVSIDGPKVERIVENLLINAARHTPTGGAIWVRVRRERAGVLLIVDDEGEGVPDEIREEIFEPFRQGQGRPTHAPGVGIGLSLVARFAALHGGRAWVEQREAGGASFRVYLPDA